MNRAIWLPLILGLALGACDQSTSSDDSTDVDTGTQNGTGTHDGTGTQDDDNTDAGQDVTAPSISIEGLSAYQGLSGSVTVSPVVTDDVGVASVELRVNGAIVTTSEAEPFELMWNTKNTADGLVNVSVKATDTAGNTAETAPVRVAVINGGIQATLENNGEGQVMVPSDYDGTQEIDVKHHWTNAVAYSKAIGVITWQPKSGQSTWELELAMGEGTCPHSGVLYQDGFYSDTGTLEAEVIPANGWPTGTQFFIHGKPMNAMDHKGESLPYKMYVFLLSERVETTTTSSTNSSVESEDTESVDYTSCPINSGYPCRCEGVAICEDGNTCVAFEDGTNTGLCSEDCTGENDETSCTETASFGLFGFCGAGKNPATPDHCVVVCEDNDEKADCPPGFACNPTYGVCIPN